MCGRARPGASPYVGSEDAFQAGEFLAGASDGVAGGIEDVLASELFEIGADGAEGVGAEGARAALQRMRRRGDAGAVAGRDRAVDAREELRRHLEELAQHLAPELGVVAGDLVAIRSTSFEISS